MMKGLAIQTVYITKILCYNFTLIKRWVMKKCLIFLVCFMLFSIISCFAETVIYNTQTHKYHQVWCRWASKMHCQLY
nr:MAG TPA: hypothetical protein [Caudoviricetes sp.]